MTVDTDYERNWNKENIPLEFTNAKAARYRHFQSKRTILGEMTQYISTGMRRMRIAERDKSIEDVPKWKKIALSLHCDPEENDDVYMRELLGLCDWSDETEKSDEKHGCAETSCWSEDEEDETFMAFIRSQNVSSFKSKVFQNSSSELEGLPFSKVCLNSQILLQQRSPLRLENCHGFMKKECSSPNCSKESNKVSSSSRFEQAFFGVISEDNDSVLNSNVTPLNNIRTLDGSSDDLWSNVQFTL